MKVPIVSSTCLLMFTLILPGARGGDTSTVLSTSVTPEGLRVTDDFGSFVKGQCTTDWPIVWSSAPLQKQEFSEGAFPVKLESCARVPVFEAEHKTCAKDEQQEGVHATSLSDVASNSGKAVPLAILSPDEFKNQVLKRHSSEGGTSSVDQRSAQPIQPSENASGEAGSTEHDIQEGLTPESESVSEDEEGNSTNSGGEGAPEGYDEEDDHVHGGRFNYASFDAGAVIMASSEAFKSTSNLLTENRDKYSLAPCKSKKWVVVGLSEDILVDTIVIANFERYASTVRQFLVLGSHQYPANEWTLLGKFEASPAFGEQNFVLPQKVWARYLKFRFLTHYEDEFYCTLSVIRVFGSTHIESIRQEIEESSKSMERIKSVAGQASIKVNDTTNIEAEATNLVASQIAQTDNTTLPAPAKGTTHQNSGSPKEDDDDGNDVAQDESRGNSTNDMVSKQVIQTELGTEREGDNFTFVLRAAQKALEVDRWLCSLRVTRLSTCSENYTMISENLNVGDVSAPRAHLCARFANMSSFVRSTPAGESGANKCGPVYELKVLKASMCPDEYITAAVLARNITVCYRRKKPYEIERSSTMAFSHLVLRNTSAAGGGCFFCAPLGRYFCTQSVESEFGDNVNNVTKDTQPPEHTDLEEDGVVLLNGGLSNVQEGADESDKNLKTSGPSSQSISGGSVESIFKTLTSKVLQLELDQSLLKQYVESVVQTYTKLFRDIQDDMDKSAEERRKLAAQVSELQMQHSELVRLREAIAEEQNVRIRLEEELQQLRNVSLNAQQVMGDLAIIVCVAVCFSTLSLLSIFRKK